MGFKTPQYDLKDLTQWAHTGSVQLPDFQRQYRWDVERVRQLIITVVRGHPMGAIMLLETKEAQVKFHPRELQGPSRSVSEPDFLLLDGQQRLTSLYQAFTGDGVTEAHDHRGNETDVRFWIDLEAALGDPSEQEESIIVTPSDGVVRRDFGRETVLDLSQREEQLRRGIMPLPFLLSTDATTWLLDYLEADGEDKRNHRTSVFRRFQGQVVQPVSAYQIPAIELDSKTSKEAVATVFEKVNTGGMPLDVFELLTATFAGDPHYYEEHGDSFRLPDYWETETRDLFSKHRVLADLRSTDFLQAISLLATLDKRKADIAADKPRPRRVSARRESILDLSLNEFLHWAPQVIEAFKWAGPYLGKLHIYSAQFMPYRSQLVALALIRTLIGNDADRIPVSKRIGQWFWCGVLGELYGSTVETRLAKDAEELPRWLTAALTDNDTQVPDSISSATFTESRLDKLHTRGSAAYKGVYALMLQSNPADWMGDQDITHANYHEMDVDIHHIFPRKWCHSNGLNWDYFDSIVNKTPLTKRTNIFISGDAPSKYLARIGSKNKVNDSEVDDRLLSHEIDPELLRSDDYVAFYVARREAMVRLVEAAMGKRVQRDIEPDTIDYGGNR